MNKQSDNIDINQLSPYLFWDVEKGKIDINKNKKWLVHRVLEYGLLKDWLLIYNYYGKDEVAQMVIQMKDLDKKSISFISLLTNIQKEKFSCYSIKQSNPEHWNF